MKSNRNTPKILSDEMKSEKISRQVNREK